MKLRKLLPIGLLTVTLALAACDRSSDEEFTFEAVEVDESASLEVQRRALDQAVLDSLKGAGADMSLPHLIEHHFVADDQADVDQLVVRGKELGFTIQSHRELPSEVSSALQRVGVALVRECLPTTEAITPDSIKMEELADEFGVDYEGWGCAVRMAEED